MVHRQERDAAKFRLLSALNTPSCCRWHCCILGLLWPWARACHPCWGWQVHCWVLHRWGQTNPQPQGAEMTGEVQETVDGYWQTGDVWVGAERLFSNAAGSHPTQPATLGSQERARGKKGLAWQQLRVFWSWLINPANVTAIQGCLSPSPFLPFHLFFTPTWEMLKGRYVLGSCLLWQQYWDDSWPERVCIADMSSHSRHLCSLSSCL